MNAFNLSIWKWYFRSPQGTKKSQKSISTNKRNKRRKNQKFIKTRKNELEFKSFLRKRKPKIEKPKVILPFCPGCRQNKWIENDRGYYCQNCEVK